ncbi:flagellar protein FliT [Dyella japonica]|uniref:Flagellar protein FliT n=1 Tax=Dyella japonica A8 TaxID=1217721 RepID=A0A075K4W9_9GAMM|nr:flagellar protein FliT [Dyella japonica]AIF49204.1 hypothetical protein HY57_19110 [Dyella japonica A8]
MAESMHAALLALSERMLAAAHAGDWDAVALLEAERGQGITSLSIAEPGVLALFRTLLAHTEEVRELARCQRERLGADLGEHQHRHRALSAYLVAGAE